jgi:hypothetical protein
VLGREAHELAAWPVPPQSPLSHHDDATNVGG